MKPHPLHVAVLAVLAAGRTASADAVDDFQAGGVVAVASATVDFGRGPKTSTGSAGIRKVAGTLDLVLQASDLGVDLPITLHLRGTVLRDRQIAYTIDETFSPAVDLGDGTKLARLTGQFYVRAAPVPGTAKQDLGNVALRLDGQDSRSALTAEGTWGRLAIAIGQLELLGGVAQPPLAAFVDAAGVTICSDRIATTHIFEVSLSGVATANGAVVELSSPFGAGVHLPGGIVVRAGNRSASVAARIEPNFVGTVRLAAAAGAAVQALAVVVHPHGDCGRR